MKTIYKFKLELKSYQILNIRGFIKCLKVGEQDGNIYLWVIINDEDNLHKLEISVVGTGTEIMEYNSIIYFDTVLMSNGFVWHIFLNSYE